MTSSSSSAPCAWRRRAASLLLLALAVVVARPGHAAEVVHGGDIEQAWFRVTQALDPFNADLLRERSDQLIKVSGQAGIRRLTPMALGLVLRARSLPDSEARLVLAQAERLDPHAAEVWFSTAQLHFRSLALVPGVQALATATAALAHDPRFSGLTHGGVLLALAAGFAAAFGLWSLVVIRRVIGRLWHDLVEIGVSWRLGSNGIVLAVVVVFLPMLAGADPVWLLLWLVALGWAYLPPLHKVVGLLGLALTVLLPTLVELGFRDLTRPPDPLARAVTALEERSYEPQVIDELAALGELFGDEASFRRLQGDCYRQFRYLDAAASSYREGLRLAPGDGALFLALGAVHFMEGEYNDALLAFQEAKRGGADAVIANWNLSLTLAHTYHYPESEAALAEARKAGDSRLRRLTRGGADQLLLANFSLDDARRLLSRKDPVLLLNRGVAPPPLLPERTYLHPLAIAALVMLILAGALSIFRGSPDSLAVACLKCGRAFCRRCRLAHESASYCTQCVNIFLKKDMVAIEAQLAKHRQLKRHLLWHRLERRIADLLLPGLGLAFAGRPLLGYAIAGMATVLATAALLWCPVLVAPALMHVSLLPLQVATALAWLALALAAQLVQAERR